MFSPSHAQVQRQAAFAKTLQTSLKVPIAVYRFSRHQLDTAAREPFIITGPRQLTIKAWRRDLQHICPAGHSIFDIKDRSELTTEGGTVLVRNPGWLVNEDPKHAAFAAAPKFNLDHFQPTGDGYAIGNTAHSVFVERHESKRVRSFAPRCIWPQTKMWACAHWCASPNAGTTQQYSIDEYTPLARKKQTREGLGGVADGREKVFAMGNYRTARGFLNGGPVWMLKGS